MSSLGRLWLAWQRLRQKLWVKPALWSLVSVAAAGVSATGDAWMPVGWVPTVRAGVVDDLLHIMATTMLAVSTFALSVLASAYASASSAGTPRATRLVVADPTAQRCVATFLAAFIFSIVGIVALGTGDWGLASRLLLFAFALLMLAGVIWAFMQYIELLSRIGRVSHTIHTVEQAAAKTLKAFARAPLGGARAAGGPPPGSRGLRPTGTGQLQYVDVPALQALCERHDGRLSVAVKAGDLVHPASTLAWLHPGWQADEDVEAALRGNFMVGHERSIEQDAGFGLIVLSEIAQRALSPAVNDPGTAITVIGSQARLLIEALGGPPPDDPAPCDRVDAPPARPEALLPIAFEAIARSAERDPDVLHQLLRHLEAIALNCPGAIGEAARQQAQRVLERARASNMAAQDVARLVATFRDRFEHGAGRG